VDPALWAELEGPADDVIAALMRLAPGAVAPDRVRIVAQFGDVATIRVRRGELLALREEPAVMSLKAPRPMAPDRPSDERPRRPSRGIRSLGNGQPVGRGAVIGIVDWGCDFAHPNLRTGTGRTRLLALWDQRAEGRSPRPYGYGVVHGSRAIDRALAADDPYDALGYDPVDADDEGSGSHGTHVIDIAAGRPRVGPGGVAPAADLVFVHLAALSWGPRHIASSVCLLEAIDFIARVARQRPWVINLSLGSHAGPHDGTTLVEQALDTIVTSAPGRVIVQSCGNYRKRPVHAAGRIAHGERRRLTWNVDPSDRTTNEIELWYPGSDAIAMNLIGPHGRTIARALPDSHGPIFDGARPIGRFAHRRHDPNNGDNQASLIVEPARAPHGTWQVELEALSIADGNYHIWIERDEVTRGSQSSLSKRDFVNSTTTGTICNGHHTISVGAYDPETRSQAWFSSLGPTRDGRDKPDILGYGVGILAARSAPLDDDESDALLTYKTGTSMASPHVAGAVAVLYEAAGRPLSAAEVKRILVDSGKRIGNGPPLLDVRAAVALAKQQTALAPDAIFDAFTVPARASLQLGLHGIELVAAPGMIPRESLEPGDLWIERALGEGGVAAARPVTPDNKQRAAEPRLHRIVVRGRKRPRAKRFTPAGAALFTPRPIFAIGTSAAARKKKTLAEAIGGFLDRPADAKIGVNRYGLYVRVGYDLVFTPGVDKAEQVIGMLLFAMIGDAYSAVLAEEMRNTLNLVGSAPLQGVAKENEIVAENGRTDIPMSSAMLGLEILRWVRDTKALKLRKDVSDQLLWRRLEHAVAVEDAWTQVFEHTKGAGKLGRSWDNAVLPPVRRYYWVDRSMFTAIAWGLGPLVETARVAMLAYEAKPTAKYGDPAFDDRMAAIGALWNKFNEGGDALDAVRADAALAKHEGYKYLFPKDPKIDASPARMRFVEFCLGLQPALAAKAKGTDKGAAAARKKLLDLFAADYKIMIDLNTLANADGEDILHDQVSIANANPFPCSLAVSPQEDTQPAGGEMSAEITVEADHWVSLWNYHYWWDLLLLDPVAMLPVGATSTSRLTMLDRRLGRELGYTLTDFYRLKRGISMECGPALIGAANVASALAIIRMVGTTLGDLVRAVFEKPYAKSLVLPGPGIYMLRCIAGDPDQNGPLHRVPSAAYHLFRVVDPKDLSKERADEALIALRMNELLWKPLTELLIKEGDLSVEEIEQKQNELALINAELAGDAASIYAVQRANLERAKANKELAAQISTDPDYVPKAIRERIAEIDRITAERTRRLGGVTGKPYRVITTLVTDMGPSLKLMIEVVDVTTTNGFDVLVVDSTAKHSGFERSTGTTRVEAIRKALFSLLENSVTGYGRGWCTILVPADGVTGTGLHARDTFRVEKDAASLLTEMIEGGSLIISVLALLAAPFTGGASLMIMIPMGNIGAIPSGYRLAKRNEEGTFAWDMETALDVVNIASAFLGVSQTGSAALKFGRLAKVFQFTGHGADGLNIIMGTGQFFDELERISADPNMLPSEKRYALGMAVSTKLLNDGVMVGHMMAMHFYGEMMRKGMDPKKFPMPKGVLPEGFELPPIKERSLPKDLKPASKEVHAKVKAIAKRDVVVVLDPELKGKSAEVRYVLDAFGFISDVYIALGPKAGDAQLPSHAATAKQLFKFTGLLGKARTLISWARAFFAKDPSRKVGKTRAWEARLELEKLPKQITDYMRTLGAELATGARTPKDVDAYIAGLFDQLAIHEAALKDASQSRKKIAAEDTSPREQAKQSGQQHAHAVTGIPIDKIKVLDAPPTQAHISVRRIGDGLEITVPDKLEGAPIHPDDVAAAIETNQWLHDKRPATLPDPTWTADREAAYQGMPPAEPGFHYELKPDGTVGYTANDASVSPRVYDPSKGTHARDPSAKPKERVPVPKEFGADYVADPVPDFYRDAPNVDDDPAFARLKPEDTPRPNRADPIQSVTTQLFEGSAMAQMTSRYTPERAELSLDAHYFNTKVPDLLPTKPPLIASGKKAGKTPTTILTVLRQMKQLGIKFGSLRRLVLHEIYHVQTVMQVHVAMLEAGTTVETAQGKPLPSALADKLHASSLSKYGRTIATQSGHAITGIELVTTPDETKTIKLGKLMERAEKRMGPLADPPAVKALHTDLYNTIKMPGDKAFDKNTVVTIGFNLILLLEDWP
jgi:subtilisin family serine protease